LFQRAIVESGSPGLLPSVSRENAIKQSESVLEQLGITPATADRLTEIEPEQVAKVNMPAGLGGWRPCIDGRILPEEEGSATATAQAEGVPLLVGTCLNEFFSGVDNPDAAHFTQVDLLKRASDGFGDFGPRIVAAYRRNYPQLPPLQLWGAIKAADIRGNALKQAERKSAIDGKAWQYVFAWATPVLGGRPGTFHSAEIAFVFNNAELCVNQTGGGPDAIQMAHRTSDAWVSFARSGNPNHPGLPQWPAFGQARSTLLLDNTCRVVNDPEAEGRKLIAESAPRRSP